MVSSLLEEHIGSHCLRSFNPIQKQLMVLLPLIERYGKFYYNLRIVTGTYFTSGTNDTGIYAILVGKKSTKKISLLSLFRRFNNDIKKSSYFDLLIETENLGEVAVVLLGNNETMKIA